MDGEYRLISTDPEARRPVWKKSAGMLTRECLLFFSDAHDKWVFKSSREQLEASERGGYTPCEVKWRGGSNIEVKSKSWSFIARLAFPAPNFNYAFYCEGVTIGEIGFAPLLACPDLVFLKTGEEGEVIPAVYAQHREARTTIIYSHGNGEDLGLILESVQTMAKSVKANVLAYDYVGYSLSRCALLCDKSAGQEGGSKGEMLR